MSRTIGAEQQPNRNCPSEVSVTLAAILGSIALIAGLTVTRVWAEDSPASPPGNTGDAVFYAVSDLPYNPDPELQLINARIGDPQDWPASFYSLSDGGRCTSTLVGPRVLLTAAHCVGDGKVARISKAGRTYRGTCIHSGDYEANKTADWALCLLDQDIPGVPFEILNADSGRLVQGGELLLTGFGCTRPDGSGGNDGIYRIGESSISRLPRENDYDIITRGGAALCFGDSGGPAFLFLDSSKTKRVLVSVNSRGNIRDTSYLSSVTVDAARKFFQDWSQSREASICGLHASPPGCRSQ